MIYRSANIKNYDISIDDDDETEVKCKRKKINGLIDLICYS